MKRGFSIYIQSDLTDLERNIAIDYVKEFTIRTIKEDMHFPLKGAGGRASFLRRGTFGRLLNKECTLVFRRISRNSRKFAVVKADSLLCAHSGNPVIDAVLKNIVCKCGKCSGGLKVKWSHVPDMYHYVTIGDIKG